MSNTKTRATPAARMEAKKLGIDLASIRGSGARGRVHKEDVLAFKQGAMIKISPLAKKIAADLNIDLSNVKGSGVLGKIMRADILSLTQSVTASSTEISKTLNRIPMSAMRKVIAKRMRESQDLSPTVSYNYEVDMGELLSLRKKLLDPVLEKTGEKLTVTDLIALAVVKTLAKKKHEMINASLSEDGQEIILHDYVHLALAVGLPDGLIVPVVKDADKMSISELTVALKQVTRKAQEGKLKGDELSGSTFTISNLGMFGITSFTPIINQPNVAILGVGATISKPVVIGDNIVARPIAVMSLTADHRIVDGMNAAIFMQDLKKSMEDPMQLFI